VWYLDLDKPHADDLYRVVKFLLLQSRPGPECDCTCPCNCLVIESFGITIHGIEITTRNKKYKLVCWGTGDPVPLEPSTSPEPKTDD
jgi:hypothetical protein